MTKTFSGKLIVKFNDLGDIIGIGLDDGSIREASSFDGKDVVITIFEVKKS